MLMLKFVGSLFRPSDWVEMVDDPFGQASSCMYISAKYISRKYSSEFVTGAQITREIIIGSGLLDDTDRHLPRQHLNLIIIAQRAGRR